MLLSKRCLYGIRATLFMASRSTSRYVTARAISRELGISEHYLPKVLQDLTEGLRYAYGFRPIRATLLLMAVISFAGMPYTVLLPVIAARTLDGGAHTLGFLMGAAGLGALFGALHLASRTSVVGLGRLIPRASLAFGGGLVAFGFSRWLPVSLALMVVIGAGFMIQMASSNNWIGA